MATDEITPSGRYISLQDYLRVLRRYRIAIIALVVLGGALGYLDASGKTATYSATSSVSFTDPNQDLSLVGYGTNSVQSPSQLAAAASQTVTQPDVMREVAGRLKTSVAPATLAQHTSATVSGVTGALEITASWTDARFAARLANTAAGVVTARDNQTTKASFTTLARTIQGRIDKLRAQAGGRPSAQTTGAETQLLFYDNEIAHIDTLKQFARSAQIATAAQPPASPSSSGKSRNVVTGALLGLLLGVIFAFVRDTLDRRLRTPRDIEASFRFPVLGYVRDESMGRIAYASDGAAGADGQRDIEVFRIVRRNLEFLVDDAAPRTILVTSGLPEEGKTTVAGSLAFAMAAAGKTTLLVDCDLRQSTLSARLDLRGASGISDFLASEAQPEDILRTIEFHPVLAEAGASARRNGQPPRTTQAPGPHRVICIPAGTPTSTATETLGSARFGEFLNEVSQVYDAVIIDSAPLLPVADTLEILPHVEAVIICARESKTTRADAAAAKAALARLPARPTGLVVTGVRPHRGDYNEYPYYVTT